MIITRQWLRENNACYTDDRIADLIPVDGLTRLQILDLQIPASDKVWVLTRRDALTPEQFVAFTNGCAERAQGYAAAAAKAAVCADAAAVYAYADAAAVCADAAAVYADEAAAYVVDDAVYYAARVAAYAARAAAYADEAAAYAAYAARAAADGAAEREKQVQHLREVFPKRLLRGCSTGHPHKD